MRRRQRRKRSRERARPCDEFGKAFADALTGLEAANDNAVFAEHGDVDEEGAREEFFEENFVGPLDASSAAASGSETQQAAVDAVGDGLCDSSAELPTDAARAAVGAALEDVFGQQQQFELDYNDDGVLEIVVALQTCGPPWSAGLARKAVDAASAAMENAGMAGTVISIFGMKE